MFHDHRSILCVFVKLDDVFPHSDERNMLERQRKNESVGVIGENGCVSVTCTFMPVELIQQLIKFIH